MASAQRSHILRGTHDEKDNAEYIFDNDVLYTVQRSHSSRGRGRWCIQGSDFQPITIAHSARVLSMCTPPFSHDLVDVDHHDLADSSCRCANFASASRRDTRMMRPRGCRLLTCSPDSPPRQRSARELRRGYAHALIEVAHEEPHARSTAELACASELPRIDAVSSDAMWDGLSVMLHTHGFRVLVSLGLSCRYRVLL